MFNFKVYHNQTKITNVYTLQPGKTDNTE